MDFERIQNGGRSQIFSSFNSTNFIKENVDINAIKLLRNEANLTYDGTRIKWTDDFISLKNYVIAEIYIASWQGWLCKQIQVTVLNSGRIERADAILDSLSANTAELQNTNNNASIPELLQTLVAETVLPRLFMESFNVKTAKFKDRNV